MDPDGDSGLEGGGDEGEGGWASLDSPAIIGATAAAGSGEGATALQEHTAALVEELALLGFRRDDATAAVAASGSSSGSGGVPGAEAEGPSLSAALDWLCMRLPEGRLPKNFAPGACDGATGATSLLLVDCTTLLDPCTLCSVDFLTDWTRRPFACVCLLPCRSFWQACVHHPSSRRKWRRRRRRQQ